MPYRFLLLFLLVNTLFAKHYSIDFFHNKPRGVVRDFYLWQFLGQSDVTKKEAEIAHKLIDNMSDKMLSRLEPKTANKYIKTESYCKRVSTQKLIKMSSECINIGLTMYEAINLPQKDLEQVINSIKNRYPQKAKTLQLLINKDLYRSSILAKPQQFFTIFNGIGNRYRAKFFDKEWPKKFLADLSRYREFDTLLEHIVTSSKYRQLPKSLLLVNPKKVSFNSTFLLAMSAIKQKQNLVALKFLDSAYKKSKLAIDKDKILFWKYLITKNQNYLKKLTSSIDINIYTIIAHQKLQSFARNIITKIKTVKNGDKFNIKDPFLWEEIKNRIKLLNKTELIEFATKFKSPQSLPHKVYILKKSDFKKHYFITPYSKYLKTKNRNKKALLYAIAKKESKFIPTAISKSFALGFMQFMPFVAKSMSKQLRLKNFRYIDMLDPKIALLFGNIHLSYLEKHFKHPLLIAYAYNKGVSFTQKMLKGEIFKQGEYKPYLSMELVPNIEAREYGKQILANYVIYSKVFGKKIMLEPLLKSNLNN